MSLIRKGSIAVVLGLACGPAHATVVPAQQTQDTISRVATAAPTSRKAEPVRLRVDLSERTLYVMRGDETVREYPVAIGQPAHPTPEGTFHIRRLVWNPAWVPPDAGWARGKTPKAPGHPNNPMVKVKIFFQEPDYYIHGTHAVDSLGQAESHGCVRMRNSDVVDVARIVMESGGSPRPPSWFQRVLNRVRSTEEVRLSDPVVVEVRE
ncbi:MAG: L,D-transpeptidase family protein [Gemmatimonadetes bacterium]|nr:L,D-transpeptidase family protein [Gemmatimonadota bacterium]